MCQTHTDGGRRHVNLWAPSHCHANQSLPFLIIIVISRGCAASIVQDGRLPQIDKQEDPISIDIAVWLWSGSPWVWSERARERGHNFLPLWHARKVSRIMRRRSPIRTSFPSYPSAAAVLLLLFVRGM